MTNHTRSAVLSVASDMGIPRMRQKSRKIVDSDSVTFDYSKQGSDNKRSKWLDS